MAFEFSETLTISVPNIEDQLSAFSESEYKANHNLIIEVAAIHEGMTANYNYYPASSLAESVQSWVSPYPKPIIMNHDAYSEPVGRVMAAKMDKEDDGTPYVRLQVAVTDPEAIRKVMDQRYLTGSVGGKAEEAICNICGADWAKASMFNLPCKHQRGVPYKGKVAHVEMRNISFKEYSFVNMPADQRSSVRSLATNATGESVETDDGWVRAARVFSIDMAKEEILELSESTTRNILGGMKKKDSSPMYHETRGAFLSAIAIAESEDDTKESNVADEIVVEEEEDILAVAEDLSSDLAAAADEATEEEVVAEADADATEETPEAQEEPSGDVSPEDSEGAPESRESDEVAPVVAEEETPVEEADDTSSETELNERIVALESRVEELEAREQSLLGENVKLKTALKQTIAERVVDTKIALGLHEADERGALLEDHMKRSASSLRDSMRDLAKMPFKARESAPTQLPTVTDLSGAVEGEDGVVTDETIEEQHINPADVLESLIVDTLMGRRVL